MTYRQGKLRGLQLVLVCSPELHLRVATELEKMRRDAVMGLIMSRHKVGRDQWNIEALIVALDLFLVNFKPDNR